jgi:hypothetical protein
LHQRGFVARQYQRMDFLNAQKCRYRVGTASVVTGQHDRANTQGAMTEAGFTPVEIQAQD